MGELLGNVEVDELLHGPRHDGGEAGRHSRYGQGEQIVKGRIQNLTGQNIRCDKTGFHVGLTKPFISG